MAIPDYQSIMLPLLKLAADGEAHRLRDAVEQLADEFELTNDERAELVPSGSQPVFHNRVSWARTYLKKAGLLEDPKRGYFQITQRGRELLAENPTRIDNQWLAEYPEFQAFRNRGRQKSTSGGSKVASTDESPSQATPEEQLALVYTQLRSELEDELLTKVKESPPSFFERLVLDLLVGMGYGGSRQEAAQAIGRSRDGGIDGMIFEDRLGLDVIYIQAKRWNSSVGRPEIQQFAGALQGQRASKGVFITTSSFSPAAEEYADQIDSRLILIDGQKLTQLMVDHGIGVSTTGVYEVKKVDTDYFTEL